jgi:hypothetical protein
MSSNPDDLSPHDDPSELGRLSRPGSSGPGSLAHSARVKHLNQARRIMIVLGLALLLIHGFNLINAKNEVRDEQKNGPVGIDEDVLVIVVQVVYGTFALLGLAFIVLGLVVRRFPIAATTLALALYVGFNGFLALLDPAALLGGIIFKIIVIVFLVKALLAAIAYQREQREAAEAGEYSA